MAVFRVEKTKDFTVMSNHHLRNVSLSLKAKGLLSLMLSLPDNWDYTTKGLAHICKDGVDSISSAIKELEKQGYLTRQRLRDAHGRLGDIEYVIHEKPVLPDEQDAILPPKRENPRQVNPRQVKPILEKPEQEKPAQLNIQESITEKSITDISNIHQSIYPALGGTPDGNAEMDRDRIDRINGFLDKSEFLYNKSSYSARITQLEQAIAALKEKRADVMENRSERNRWIENFKRFSDLEELDRKAIIQLVQVITVLGKDELQIQFNYQDEYEKAIALIAPVQERMVV